MSYIGNGLSLRYGNTTLWANSWYLDFKIYNSFFLENYYVLLYIVCLFKKLKINLERFQLKFLASKVYINLYYCYKNKFIKKKDKKKKKAIFFFKKMLYLTMKFFIFKNLYKNIFNIKKYKKIRKKFIKKKLFKKLLKKVLIKRKKKNLFKKIIKKIFKFNFYKKIENKNLIILEKKIRLRYNYIFKTFLYKKMYINYFFSKIKKNLYNILFLIKRIFILFYPKTILYFLIINLNAFLSLLTIKQVKYLYFIKRHVYFKYFFNLFLITYISLFFKNIKLLSFFVSQSLTKFYQKYNKYFKLLKSLFTFFYKYCFQNYVLGYRIQIKGKVKGRKKNMASYYLITAGPLYLKSVLYKLRAAYSFSITKYGILGIKIWVSYFSFLKKSILKKFYKKHKKIVYTKNYKSKKKITKYEIFTKKA